jgi:hypothetical protein
MRGALAAFLGLALALAAAGDARAQAVAADPVLPCCPFEKAIGIMARVTADGFDGASSTFQSYYDLTERYDPLDPNPNRLPVFFSEIGYSLEASVAEGNGRVTNTISSQPFRPWGARFRGDTSMAAGYMDPGQGVVATEQFSFSAFQGNPQQGSATWGGMEFYTGLTQGHASTHVEFDSLTHQLQGSYLGDGIGTSEAAVSFGAVSGETGVGSSSRAYSGSVSVSGDYTVRYNVSHTPSSGCLLGW